MTTATVLSTGKVSAPGRDTPGHVSCRTSLAAPNTQSLWRTTKRLPPNTTTALHLGRLLLVPEEESRDVLGPTRTRAHRRDRGVAGGSERPPCPYRPTLSATGSPRPSGALPGRITCSDRAAQRLAVGRTIRRTESRRCAAAVAHRSLGCGGGA